MRTNAWTSVSVAIGEPHATTDDHERPQSPHESCESSANRANKGGEIHGVPSNDESLRRASSIRTESYWNSNPKAHHSRIDALPSRAPVRVVDRAVREPTRCCVPCNSADGNARRPNRWTLRTAWTKAVMSVRAETAMKAPKLDSGS